MRTPNDRIGRIRILASEVSQDGHLLFRSENLGKHMKANTNTTLKKKVSTRSRSMAPPSSYPQRNSSGRPP